MILGNDIPLVWTKDEYHNEAPREETLTCPKETAVEDGEAGICFVSK